MRRYNFFHAPVMSFFSPGFYRDVGLYWKGTGFAYLILLSAICSVPTFIGLQRSAADYVDNKAPALTSQIPPIKIINGEASAAVAQPHKIVDPESKKILAIIDTTGQTISSEQTDIPILLTKTEIIIKKNDVETRTIKFKDIKNFSLDQERVAGWFKLFRTFGPIIMFLFAMIGIFIFRIVQLLIYAAIGLLFAELCKVSLSYQTLFRLSVMAVTPVLILDTIIGSTKVNVPFSGLIFSIAAMLYLLLAVKAVSQPDNNPE